MHAECATAPGQPGRPGRPALVRIVTAKQCISHGQPPEGREVTTEQRGLVEATVGLPTGPEGDRDEHGPWPGPRHHAGDEGSEGLREHPALVVGIDHHANGSDIAPCRVVQPSCASCTQVLVGVLDEMGIPLAAAGRSSRHSIAEAIFAGLATDTGWFRFSGADDRVFQLAARLLSLGVDKDGLYRMLEQGDAPGRLMLVARALRSVEFCCEGRVALMRLTPADFAETGTGVDDLAGLVNEPMSVATVEVSVLLTESEPALVKASFRSKPPAARGASFVDVNHLAGRFDGGGHVHAAGARIGAPMDEAAARVRAACDAYFESADAAVETV